MSLLMVEHARIISPAFTWVWVILNWNDACAHRPACAYNYSWITQAGPLPRVRRLLLTPLINRNLRMLFYKQPC